MEDKAALWRGEGGFWNGRLMGIGVSRMRGTHCRIAPR